MKRFILVLLVMILAIVGLVEAAKDKPPVKPTVLVIKGKHSYDYTVTHSRPGLLGVVATVRCVEKDETSKVVETRTVRVIMTEKDFANDDLLVEAADKEWDKPVPTPRPTVKPRVLHYTDN